MALPEMASAPELLTQRIRKQLLAQARSGEVVMLDVRPQSEFDAAHLPHARSMPLPELARRLSELPRDVEIVAYCRGPFCLMSGAAVTLLRAHGFQARKTLDGISDWLVAGLSLSRACASSGMATHHPKDPAMTMALFIVNDAPHGKERAPTALRLASEVAGKAGQNAHRQGGSRSRLCRLQGATTSGHCA